MAAETTKTLVASPMAGETAKTLVTAAAAPRMRLLDLSEELLELIIRHVLRPTDLVSLCLTCKALHELTVRELYHTVTLDIGSEADNRLPAFINPRNIGLRHVRNVELYRADVVEKCNQLQQADFAIRMLLEFLPENTIEKFSWHPWVEFSAENMVLLYKKQRKMKWLEAIQLDRPICECLKKDLNLDMVVTENITRLGLYPDNRSTMDFCHELLKRTKRLDKITLHSNFELADPPIPSRELNDSSTGPGLVTSTIFAHMMPFASCTPMALKELTLQKVHLRYAADTYCKIIDFSKMKILRVFACSGADALFAELCKSSKLPEKLETLEVKHEDDGKECESRLALEGFLCLVSGLKKLTIDISNTDELPSAACITRHSKTLKILNVHANKGRDPDLTEMDEDEHVFEQESFDKICKDCTLLEQLSVGFPSTHIARAPTDEFTAFTDSLGALPNLVTLNITTWPTNGPASFRLARKQYDTLLQGMAQGGFDASALEAAEHNRTSRLNVIAWGTSNKIYEREDSSMTCAIFIKGKQVDPLGRESTVACQIGWCLRKYVEPRSDVLDFALLRQTRPPTREPPSSDDSELFLD